MTMDLATFRVQYPEFVSAPDTLVNPALARAIGRVDVTVWGTWTDEAVGLLTAHLLAIAPNGTFARLVSKAGETVYQKQFNELMYASTCGLHRVI